MPAAAILVALLWSEEIGRAPPPILKKGARQAKLVSLQLSGWLNVVFCWQWLAHSSVFYLLGDDPTIPNLRSYVQQSGLPVLGVIWAITAVAGAVLLLRRRWRWLSVNLLGFGVCDLCAHACLLPGRSSASCL